MKAPFAENTPSERTPQKLDEDDEDDDWESAGEDAAEVEDRQHSIV